MCLDLASKQVCPDWQKQNQEWRSSHEGCRFKTAPKSARLEANNLRFTTPDGVVRNVRMKAKYGERGVTAGTAGWGRSVRARDGPSRAQSEVSRCKSASIPQNPLKAGLDQRLLSVKPVLNWANVCSPEQTSDTSTNYDSFLN